MNLIFYNAAVTYGRSLVSLLLGLFSSRWVLQALGTSDFGISVAIGSLIAFGTFWGDLLRISVARNFAYAIGHDGLLAFPKWFWAACLLHFTLAVLMVGVLWPSGEYFLRYVLVFPEGRLGAALVLLRLSIFSLFMTTLLVPFGALFTAYQRFGVPSAIGILQSLWVFACAWGLRRLSEDRLTWYGVYMCVGVVGFQLVQTVCSVVIFHVRRNWFWGKIDPSRTRNLLSFAGWSLFGGGGYLVAVHGSSFATNRFFGTMGNAAYGIAQQIQFHTEALANALVGAFEPAVTTHAAVGNADGARQLAGQGGLLAALLLAFFAVPLITEMETVLGLWLVNPPPYAGMVCSILLSVSVANKLTMGQQMAISADGRIACWQMCSGVAQVMALPATIAYAVLGGGVLSAAIAYASVFFGCLVSNLYYGQKIARISIVSWFMGQFLPFIGILFCSVCVATLPRWFMGPGLVRLLSTSLSTSLIFLIGFCILLKRWKQ